MRYATCTKKNKQCAQCDRAQTNDKDCEGMPINKVTFLRIREHMTQKELSQKSGVPKRTLEKYEQGCCNIKNARAIFVYQLSKALNCSLEDILF